MHKIPNRNINKLMTNKTLNIDGNDLTSASTSMFSPSNLLISLNGLNALNALSALNEDKDCDCRMLLPFSNTYQSITDTTTIIKSSKLEESMKYAPSSSLKLGSLD